MKITADFSKIVRPVKPMHGINQPPMTPRLSEGKIVDFTMFHYLKEAGIPYSRLHDVAGSYGGHVYVDIPNIFRDFDADENLPESYDFAFTDVLLENLMKYGCEPFFRLGITIEGAHMVKAYNVYPPKDPEKWARICEHIIRHYNEGWANGFHYGITYWEIWNEPDCCYKLEESNLWHGTPEQYYQLYSVSAVHLKKCFGDTIKVGGYGAINLNDLPKDPEFKGLGRAPETKKEFYIEFMHGFLKYITSAEHKAPLDFFSWHTYSATEWTIKQARYIQNVLKRYGLENVERILDEWNVAWRTPLDRATPMAAANSLAIMLSMQKEGVALCNYYDARLGASVYGGMFNPDNHKPYLTYYAFMMFNEIYKLSNEIETASESDTIVVCGASNGKKNTLLVVNLEDKPVSCEFDVTGVSTEDTEILMINDIYQYTPTGKHLQDGTLTLPAYSCTEIRFYE